MDHLTFYDLLPTQLRERVVLDYPLDNLLCRTCELAAYEQGLLAKLKEVHAHILKVMAELAPADRELARESTRGWRTGRKWNEPCQAVPLLDEYRQAVRDLLYDGERERTTQFGAIRLPPVRGADADAPKDLDAAGRIAAHAGTTGNILIRGRPGTCKSTLALQLATAATLPPNHYMSMFICLEESPEQVLAKCQEMTWDGQFVRLRHLTGIDAASSSEEIGRCLDDVLRPDCEGEQGALPLPKVFLPLLSPRSLRPTTEGTERTFQTRYEQLERLLRGFRWLRDNDPDPNKHRLPDLRLVCIDSLSALAERPLTREELYRVFDLFKTYGVVGIATAEDQAGENSDTMDYLADVVLDLRAEHDAGYAVRYFEVKKSRHQHQVYGLHPFVVRNHRAAHRERPPDRRMFQAVMVYPSIHYNVMALRRLQDQDEHGQKDLDIGLPALRNVLSHGLRRPSTVTIAGPRGTYKSHIARNFLLQGIAERQSVMLIHFGGHRQFRPDQWGSDDASAWLMSNAVRQELNGSESNAWRKFTAHAQENGLRGRDTAKVSRHVWSYTRDGNDEPPAVLVELDFPPGALLPEQFLKFVRDVFRHARDGGEAPIRRIVIDDVSLIGTSYPFLRRSMTAGDLFLSALVHLARYHSCDTVLVGTSGEYSEADDVVRRAETLADSVLSCDFCDVFGARFITVLGEGLMVGRARDPDNATRFDYGEYVPGVVVPGEKGCFDVDLVRLEGLVGFEQRQVQRPGLVLSLFSEGEILRQYNAEVRTLVERSFASFSAGQAVAGSRSAPAESELSVLEFDSRKSRPLQESLGVLHGNPIDKTVIYALDEFFAIGGAEKSLCEISRIQPRSKKYREKLWSKANGEGDAGIFAAPYYSNVLLLAYNTDFVEEEGAWLENGRVRSWELLRRAVRRNASTYSIECGTWSNETLACVVLDVLLSVCPPAQDGLASVRSLVGWGEEQREKLVRECNALRELFADSLRFGQVRELQHLRANVLPKKQPDGEPGSARRGSSRAARRMLRYLEQEIDTYRQRLVHDSAIYICWYTQLRELISEHPNLAPRLKVAALPGGGICGDWYLGVVKGSVSVRLAENVLNILTSPREDNRRFIQGVGLPVYEYDGAESRRAWPQGEATLQQVLDVHTKAKKRSDIADYLSARETLATLGEQIIFPADRPAEALPELLERIQEIFARELVDSRPAGLTSS